MIGIGKDGAPVASPPVALSSRVVLDAWRSLTPRTLVLAFLVGTGYVLYFVITRLPLGDSSWLMWTFLWRQADVFAIVLCVVVANRLTGGDPQSRAPYAWAVLIGAFVTEFVAAMLLGNPHDGERLRPEIAVYYFLELALLGFAGVFIYTDRQRARAAVARLEAAELDRVRTSKQVLESQLQAMQARVEPQFLFNTLGRVKALYERDPSRADRMLEELIAYLRAAMPSMRDTVSTVGREVELVRAFLAIVRLRTDDRLDVRIDVPDEALAATLPPMMLLPLVDASIVQTAERQTDRIGLQVRVDGTRLRIVLSTSNACADDEAPAFRTVRERLAALYGDGASLNVRAITESGTEVVLELPFELSDTSLQPDSRFE